MPYASTGKLLRLSLSVASLLTFLALSGPPAFADDAKVTISDTGFDPPVLNISINTTVFFTNTGSKVHSATTKQMGGVTPFDTGGIGNGQTVSINFQQAGSFPYTSAVDCGNAGGTPTQGFDCTSTPIIIVNYPGGAPNTASLTPLPTPVPTQVLSGPPQSAAVHITGKGFDPPTVTVALGGSVTFINDDNGGVHNAITTGGGNPQPFDTGGIGSGLQNSFTFALQGTYTYTSAVDCISGKNPNFNCGTYQIVVSGQPSGLAQAPSVGPTAPVGSITQVMLQDKMFNPQTLAIHPGQTVTWTNIGTTVHTVKSDPGYPDQFDSGGIGPGQSYSHKFQNAGTYGYHSTTEVNYAVDQFGVTIPQWLLTGTVLVQ